MLTLWKIKEFGSINASAEYLCIYFALILETNNVSADTLPKYYRHAADVKIAAAALY